MTGRSGTSLSPSRLGRLSGYLRSAVERAEVAGVVALVACGDEVHVEAVGVQDLDTGRAMRRDTIFRIASMTKPIVAAAALSLVEETRLRLDDPIDRWLPELADRRVLKRLDGPIDDTVPANRPITVRDLLTFRLGVGVVMAPPGTYPIQQAIEEAGVGPGPDPFRLSADAYLARLGALPLLHQPGEQWMYDTGSDVLGVLLQRVTGQDLDTVLRDRVTGPLGMTDTGLWVPDREVDRLATAYKTDPASGQLVAWDHGADGLWSRPPAFPSGGGGLASTADDYLAFARMLLAGGQGVLARPTVELMTTDQLTPGQKARSPFFPGFWDSRGWGMGLAVHTRREGIAASPGAYGWDGGYGTTWISDPREDLTCILLMQRTMAGPDDYGLNADFLTLAYAALADR